MRVVVCVVVAAAPHHLPSGPKVGCSDLCRVLWTAITFQQVLWSSSKQRQVLWLSSQQELALVEGTAAAREEGAPVLGIDDGHGVKADAPLLAYLY